MPAEVETPNGGISSQATLPNKLFSFLTRLHAKLHQDAAEKALRDAYGGKKDVLAEFDQDGGDGDGGDGDGGGWNWQWSWEDFGHGFLNLLKMFIRWLQDFAKGIAGFLLFGLGLVLVGFIGPIANGVLTFIKIIFRLEKAEDVIPQAKKGPAGRKSSALFSDDEEESSPSK